MLFRFRRILRSKGGVAMGVLQDFARRGGILEGLRGFRGNVEDLGEFCGYLGSDQDFGIRGILFRFDRILRDLGRFCRISGGQGGLR